MMHVNIIMLPVDINKSHVNIHVILFHVAIIDLAYRSRSVPP